MIRKFIILFAFLALFALLMIMFTNLGHCWAFDKKHGNIKLSDEPGFTHVRITTIGIASGLVAIPSKNITGGNNEKWRKKDGSFLLQGSGCVVNNRYIITAAHVVHPISVTLAESQWNYYKKGTIKVINRLIFINNDITLRHLLKGSVAATIYYLDIKNDIAILEFKADNIFESVNYSLSNTKYCNRGRLFDMIETGDAIAMIVRCRGENGELEWGFEIKYGYVISNMVEGVPKEKLPWFNMNDFTMDLVLNGGDSGSAIFAFNKGTPVIIGIARATNEVDNPFDRSDIRDLRSYATRVDFVKEVVEAE